MDITPTIPEDRQVIDSYGPGRFQISGLAYEGALIVTPFKTVIWEVSSVEELVAEMFDPLLALQELPEIMLLGTGARTEFVSPSIRRNVKERIGIGFDIMDTGAACRTYNVLISEGRTVAAGLFTLPAS